ncbi:MAG: hypothetical protein AAGD28_05850 [Bacteroidota bacterium]
MKAVYEVLIQQFYRRNFLLFFLCLSLLAFVFRPPTLLISPFFIEGMIKDLTFFGVVSGLIGLYYIKCLTDTWRNIRLSENRFLYLLGALPNDELFLIMVKVLLGVMGPGMLYMMVIAGYSIYYASWHIWLILGAHSLLIAGAAWGMMKVIQRPNEREIKSGWQYFLEGKLKKSLSFIQIQMIWFRKRRQVIILKGISLGLLGLMAWSEYDDPFAPKALDLLFLCIASLQCVYAYQLRRAEDESIFILRNLPIPRYKRYFSYVITGLLIYLPEFILWNSFLPTDTSFIQSLSFYAVGMGVWMLGIALLYYKPMLLPDFIQWIFGMFMTLFVLILFGVGAKLSGLLVLLFSSWIFFEEYYKWNGFKEA